MKQYLKTLILILLAFLLQVTSSEPLASNRWKITELKTKGSLNLTGNDWLFKSKIKNIGDKPSKGETISLTIKVYGGSSLLETKYISINPGHINSGESSNFDFSISGYESSFTYQKITLEIQSSETDGFSETFDIKRKGR